MALAAAGREREARDTALRIEARADSARGEGRLVGDADLDAMAWAAVGDLDRAFAALETSYRVRSSSFLPFIKYWPAFDPLRGDPRYQICCAGCISNERAAHGRPFGARCLGVRRMTIERLFG